MAKEDRARLVQAGGGDKTHLLCSGSTTSVGAKKITLRGALKKMRYLINDP